MLRFPPQFVTTPSPVMAPISSFLLLASNTPPASVWMTVSFKNRFGTMSFAVAPDRMRSRPPTSTLSVFCVPLNSNRPSRTSTPLSLAVLPTLFFTANVPGPIFASAVPFAVAASRRHSVVSDAFSATSTTPVPEEALRLRWPAPAIVWLPPEAWIAPTVYVPLPTEIVMSAVDSMRATASAPFGTTPPLQLLASPQFPDAAPIHSESVAPCARAQARHVAPASVHAHRLPLTFVMLFIVRLLFVFP